MSVDDITDDDIASVKISLHYEANDFFIAPNRIIDNIKKIQMIPTVIVHGRYDLLCPLESVFLLKKELNDVQVVILPSSGHRLTADGEVAKKISFSSSLNSWIQK